MLWELTRHPWDVLQTVSREKIKEVLGDPAFRKKIDALVESKMQAAQAPAWFQQNHPRTPLSCVAYFSMEFMLSEALPITPLRQPNGEWLRLKLDLPGYPVWLRAWQVQVGRVKLYLLDSNDTANLPAHRGMTSELYGGGPELRLQQEMVLGIGGWRLLRAPGIEPEVCHLNEGHASFAVLERARAFMEESGQPFEVTLYGRLEREVIPEFYTRDDQGIPTAWVSRMRESMALLTPRFSANRAVREYTERHYHPAARGYRARAEKQGAAGSRVVDWLHAVEQQWAALHFGEVKSVGRLRVPRGGVGGPAAHGLHRARTTLFRWCGGPAGKRTDPVAALIGPRRRGSGNL